MHKYQYFVLQLNAQNLFRRSQSITNKVGRFLESLPIIEMIKLRSCCWRRRWRVRLLLLLLLLLVELGRAAVGGRDGAGGVVAGGGQGRGRGQGEGERGSRSRGQGRVGPLARGRRRGGVSVEAGDGDPGGLARLLAPEHGGQRGHDLLRPVLGLQLPQHGRLGQGLRVEAVAAGGGC